MAITRVDDAASFLFGVWSSRPLGKRVLTLMSLVMGVLGIGMILWNPITHLYSSREQDRLEQEFVSPEFQSRFRRGEIADGEVLTRIVIEAIDVDALIVEGTDPKALRAGAGHYKQTAMPCQTGNVGIAGHRTTYGKPFNRLDELRPGDRIQLVTATRNCTYRVIAPARGLARPSPASASWITTPNDGAVIGPIPGSFLTLTTCHPKGSAAKRLILRAQLETAA